MDADARRHGAYLCISARPRDAAGLAGAPVPALVQRLGFGNEFFTTGGHPRDAVAFLTRVESSPGDFADALGEASAVLHVASNESGKVTAFIAEFERLALPCALRVLSGFTAPTAYTGGAMHQFAYAGQLMQQDGAAMPNAFLLPLRKLPEWWAKDWMERHTYFLPRYDEMGRRTSEGHPLAAAAGIAALMRRTYRCAEAPPATGGYDFLTYFECADAGVATFHEVCAALRDVRRNPEWQFVREGPTWRGRRMPSWSSLWREPSNTSPTTAAR